MLEQPLEPSVLTMEKSEGLANQQGRLVSWFAGFVDGEGTFNFTSSMKRNSHTVHFQVCNTNQSAFERCCEILDSHGIKYHIATQKLREHWKLVWKIEITRMFEVRRIAMLLLPHLVVKKRQAEEIVRFVNSREKTPYHGYTPDQIQAVRMVRGMNKRGPSETLRSPYPQQGVAA